MSSISNIRNPWRDLLKTQASFRGIMFHVESGSRSSGQRTVVHEYPKRDDPYSEGMGRHARRFQFTGYLVYKPLGTAGDTGIRSNAVRYDYVDQRKKLIDALEAEGPGPLVHPVFWPNKPFIMVMCERYSMTETRQRGGYTEFDMLFVEAGNPGNSVAPINTVSNVQTKADALDTSAASTIDNISSTSGIDRTTSNPGAEFPVGIP